MTILVPIALFGWIPVVLALFGLLPARRALIVGVLFAWLFLPVAGYKLLEGIPAYDKVSATSCGLMLAIAVFDSRRLLSFRPTWADLPMLIWCVCPVASSLSNGLGLYDGISEFVGQLMLWGLPYLMGRLYLNDLAAIRDLACGLFIGGLIYVPFCLFEVRWGPIFSIMLYGFMPGSISAQVRGEGFRPLVFMQHGLMVGLWMTAASLMGVWLWARGVLRRLWGIPLAFLVGLLLTTTVLCKSVGALFLLAFGLLGSWLAWRAGSRAVIVCILSVAPLYMVGRLSGTLPRVATVEAISALVGEARAGSLSDRMEQEDIFIERASHRPFFGWAPWNFIPRDEWGQKTIRGVDSLWMIALGSFGYVGLAAVTTAMLLPSCLFFWRYPPQLWRTPRVAPAAALAVVLSLYVVDCMFNGMINPVFGIGGGGLVSLYAACHPVRRSLAARTELRRSRAAAIARRRCTGALGTGNHSTLEAT